MPDAAMTPYEHYCEAERILSESEKFNGTIRGWTVTPIALTKAHIHATLANVSGEVNAKATMSLIGQRERQARNEDGPDG